MTIKRDESKIRGVPNLADKKVGVRKLPILPIIKNVIH